MTNKQPQAEWYRNMYGMHEMVDHGVYGMVGIGDPVAYHWCVTLTDLSVPLGYIFYDGDSDDLIEAKLLCEHFSWILRATKNPEAWQARSKMVVKPLNGWRDIGVSDGVHDYTATFPGARFSVLTAGSARVAWSVTSMDGQRGYASGSVEYSQPFPLLRAMLAAEHAAGLR